jgi:MFS family permease
MMASEAGAACATVVLATLLSAGQLQVWHIYVGMSIISTLAAFQWPAFTAATTLLAPKHQLANASGLVQLAHGVAKTAAPVLAGVMMSSNAIGVRGVLFIDTTSYLFALATLLLVRFPEPERADAGLKRRSLRHEIVEGWRYLWARPGLIGLLVFLAATNFIMGMIMVLVSPLVLSFSNAEVLGRVMSIAGVGMFVGSVLISVWGGPRRKIHAVFGFLFLSGAALIPAGLPASAGLVAAGAFVFMLGVPVMNGCSQAILQCKVRPDMQGRVFSTTTMVASSSLPLAFILAGPLADRVFEPLLAHGGALAGSVGALIGAGPGRGIAFMFIVLGVLLIAMTAAGWSYRPLNKLEDELPDVIADAMAAEANAGCALAETAAG